MPSTSVIGAVIERVEGFTFSVAGVSIWFDQAPLKNGAGVAVVPPYVVIHDDSTNPIESDFEHDSVFEATALRLEVYALTLADIDSIITTIRYNGGTITQGLGMVFAATLPITGSDLKESLLVSEQRFQEGSRNVDGKLVFRCRAVYKITVQRTAA